MITLQTPQMALNVPDYYARYQMWNTRLVHRNVSPRLLIQQVRAVAANAPGNKLRHLVFNCHGAPGNLDVGRGISPFDIDDMREYWRGLIDVIWMTSCNAAQGERGAAFCGSVAAAVDAWVVGSESAQVVEKWDCGNSDVQDQNLRRSSQPNR